MWQGTKSFHLDYCISLGKLDYCNKLLGLKFDTDLTKSNQNWEFGSLVQLNFKFWISYLETSVMPNIQIPFLSWEKLDFTFNRPDIAQSCYLNIYECEYDLYIENNRRFKHRKLFFFSICQLFCQPQALYLPHNPLETFPVM